MEDDNIFYLEMEQECTNKKLKEIIQYDIMNKLDYSNKYERFHNKLNDKQDLRILSKSPNLSNNNINPPPSSSYNKKLRFFINLFKKEN